MKTLVCHCFQFWYFTQWAKKVFQSKTLSEIYSFLSLILWCYLGANFRTLYFPTTICAKNMSVCDRELSSCQQCHCSYNLFCQQRIILLASVCKNVSPRKDLVSQSSEKTSQPHVMCLYTSPEKRANIFHLQSRQHETSQKISPRPYCACEGWEMGADLSHDVAGAYAWIQRNFFCKSALRLGVRVRATIERVGRVASADSSTHDAQGAKSARTRVSELVQFGRGYTQRAA